MARAMLRLGDGKVEEAWADLLTCHRLARLLGRDSVTVIQALVAQTAIATALAGDQALLQHVNLAATQAEKMRHDLASLAPNPEWPESWTWESDSRFSMM